MKKHTRSLAQANRNQDQTLHVRHTQREWCLTYQGRPCTLWSDRAQLATRKYPPTHWQQEGSARRAAEKYNREFRTLAFGYVEMLPRST